jgi:hypothetical protein
MLEGPKVAVAHIVRDRPLKSLALPQIPRYFVGCVTNIKQETLESDRQ